MANEIFVNSSISVTKGFLSLSRDANFQPDMIGEHVSLVAQTIGMTPELLDIDPDIIVAGISWFANLSAVEDGIDILIAATDDVDGYGVLTAALLLIKPGERQSVRLATTQVYAQAIGDSAILEHCVFED